MTYYYYVYDKNGARLPAGIQFLLIKNWHCYVKNQVAWRQFLI